MLPAINSCTGLMWYVRYSEASTNDGTFSRVEVEHHFQSFPELGSF